MIYERLTLPVLPRLKVGIRIVRIVYQFDLIPHINGLHCIGLGQQNWTHVLRGVDTRHRQIRSQFCLGLYQPSQYSPADDFSPNPFSYSFHVRLKFVLPSKRRCIT